MAGKLTRLYPGGIYGNWKAVGEAEPLMKPDGKRQARSKVQCLLCGRICVSRTSAIRNIDSSSCNWCSHIKHGMTGTQEYRAWGSMIGRCTNINNQHYEDYGGRGITVYEPWRQDFVLWYDHIGPSPGKEYSQNRIDNNKNYEPGNIEWATKTEQVNNRRCTAYMTISDETMAVSDMCRKYNVDYDIIRDRLRRGWSDYESIFGRS